MLGGGIILGLIGLYLIIQGFIIGWRNAEMNGIVSEAYQLLRDREITKDEYSQLTFLARNAEGLKEKALAWELYNIYRDRATRRKMQEAAGWVNG